MHRRFPGWILALIIVCIAITTSVAIYKHLYFHIWWLDIPMHFFGGLWIGLFVLEWYYRSPVPKTKDRTTLFVATFALSAVLVLGIAWELFELSAQTFIERAEVHDMVDTLADLTNDFFGAIVAILIFLRGRYNQ